MANTHLTMKKNILFILLIILCINGFSQNAMSDGVVFQRNNDVNLYSPNSKKIIEIKDLSELEKKVRTQDDLLVRFPGDISKELLIKEEWVFYTGIQSPYDTNTWLCLERTIMGNEFNLFLFDTQNISKKILISKNASTGNFSYRPVCWSSDKSIVYLERLEFDTGAEHEGLYSYNLSNGELKKLPITEKYMSTPLISVDGKYFVYTATTDSVRELVHGTADKIMIFTIESLEEDVVIQQAGSNYFIYGWFTNQPFKKKILVSPNENIAQLSFKLPWVSGNNYCVTRDGSNSPPGSPGSGSSCANLGPHSYPAATDFDTPNNADHKVLAVAAGTVTSVVYSTVSYGNCVVITHSDGYRTRYAHNKSIAVTQGQQVQQGCYLAIEGTTGNSSGDHIHFEYEYPGGSGNLYAYFTDCGGCVPHRGYSYTSSNTVQPCNTIAAPPAPTISSTNTCGNKTLSRSSPPSGVTYYWQGTSCGMSTANSAANYTVTATGTYYLRAKSSSGTWSTCSSKAVTINQNPATPPVPTVSTNVCGGKTLTRSAPPAGTAYYWQTTCANSTSSSALTYIAPFSGTFRLRARTTAGCWSTNCAAVSVLVNPNPSPVISGPNSVCSNSNGVVYSVVNTGNTFSWSVTGGTIVSGQNTNTVTVNWGNTGTGVLSITETSPSNCVTTVSLNVTISSSLNPTIWMNGPSSFCEGGSVMLDASYGYDSYLWSTGDTTQIISVSTTGNYSVTVSDTNGCSGTSAQPINVIVHPLPPVPIITINDSVLTSSANSGNQWYMDSVMVDSATASTFSVLQNGVFWVVVTDPSTGCFSQSEPMDLTALSIGEPENDDLAFIVYPNPNNGSFTVKFNNSYEQIKLKLVNVLGEEILVKEIKPHATLFTINNIARGIYVIQVVVDNRLYHKKITVQ